MPSLKLLLVLLAAIFLSGCNLIGGSKPAALQVSSVPEASVFVDGVHLGKTPFYSDQLKAGAHTLKITASQASFVQNLDLASETLTVVNRELNDNFMAQSGETLWLENDSTGVFIASSPAAAEVEIGGKFKGKTPLLVGDLAIGEHKVSLTHPGYVTREFTIQTSHQYKILADVTLASEVAKNSKNLTVTQNEVKKLEVLRTPQGYLRVRKEPDLASDEVGRVNTGDQLEIIQETEDWVKISFEGKLGWISVQYTKKL